ncbi:MAG: DNA mismatch repair endonuclease MutL [Holosporales bacterium]|jgi:DNA mismatch repair protein MutL|nr:DNA mismatch repair endonuclease MutL [Holosporales bacterium]
MSCIRRLPHALVNQIAAGEVIARPAAVVKELVENALDAGATCIDVTLEEGGKSAIIVQDNGVGMNHEDLTLCVERHTTSKLKDLTRIPTFGFRGEALAALGSVCRMTLTSCLQNASQASRLSVEGGKSSPLEPAPRRQGTCVEVQDLFFATPARLKFLKSTATERAHCEGVFKRLALAHPAIAFRLFEGTRTVLSYKPGEQVARITEVLGNVPQEDLLPIDATEGAWHLSGVLGRPTITQATTEKQFFFANGRAIQDPNCQGALRFAFQELIARHRYPVAVLFLTLPLEEVDVNVHPAKTEVRFQNPRRLRSFLIWALAQTLQQTPMEKGAEGPRLVPLQKVLGVSQTRTTSARERPPRTSSPCLAETQSAFQLPSTPVEPVLSSPSWEAEKLALFEEGAPCPLGHAKGQIRKRYILAETEDALVIVDQHAAHERIIYERTKEEFAQGGVAQQALLLPVTLSFDEDVLELFAEQQTEFFRLGLSYVISNTSSLIVEALPTFLRGADPRSLMQDLAEELQAWGKGFVLSEKFHEVFATLSCHTSIRSGRTLSLNEMESLLRTLEKTVHAGQCNHGRPTYLRIPFAACDKFFAR